MLSGLFPYWRTKNFICLPVLFLAAAGVYAQAPHISYSSPQVYMVSTTISPLAPVNSGGAVPVPTPVILAGALHNPTGITVDVAGNVYVAENGANAVKKIPVGGGSVVALGSGFTQPTGVAVDASGNVYVADNGNNAIKEIPAGGGAIITLGSGFNHPYGIALDTAGNIYVTDTGNNLVKKMPAGGGTPVIIASGFNTPTGIAVDVAGNVYVADRGNNSIKKIPAGGGNTIAFAAGNGNPNGVAVDAAGNVYFADTHNAAIRKIPAGGGPSIPVGSGFSQPVAVAVDAAGKVYVSDSDHNAVERVDPGNYTISPALPAGLFLDSNTGIIRGTPAIPSVATDYHVTTFNSSGSSSATVRIKVVPSDQLSSLKISAGKLSPSFARTVTNYKADVANTVTSITVTPTALGAGATIKVNGTPVTSGTASASIPINVGDNIINISVTAEDGVTTGEYTIKVSRFPPAPALTYTSPQVDTVGIAISPLGPAARSAVGPFGPNSNPVAVGSGFNSPFGIAVDAAGNIYVADYGNEAVEKIPAGGGAPVTLASGKLFTGVAVDAAGNVYAADATNDAIDEIPVGGGPAFTFATGFFSPDGLASDAAGNIYVADTAHDLVKRVPAGGGATVSIGSGFSAPTGVAVDAFGNVYVADFGHNAIKKILASDGSTVTLIAGHGAPSGVAVDAVGNVYFSTGYSVNQVYEIPVGGGPMFTVGSGFKSPDGLAIDAAGKMYVADEGNNAVKKITPLGGYFISAALPAGLTFDENTGIISGTPTAVSPATNYTITAYNGGGSGSATVNIKTVAKGPQLTGLIVGGAALSPKFAGDTLNYVASVPPGTTSTTITPTAADAGSTITVNGTPVTSGTASAAIPLSPGGNTITTVVTAPGGAPQTTYTVVVTRAALSDANLASLDINYGALSPAFDPATTDYTDSVQYDVTSVRVTPVTSDPGATVTVNGTPVASSTRSPAFPLNVGNNTISVVVQNGTTAKTYTVVVKRRQSSNTNLMNLTLNYGKYPLSPSFIYTTFNYTASVNNDTTSVNVVPAIWDPNATVTVNNVPVFSGAARRVMLNVGPNIINATVTAHDGVTTGNYTITVTRAAPGPITGNYQSLGMEKPIENTGRISGSGDGIVVHTGLSPNGDGVNDFLVIEGIKAYPDNKLTIISRNGTLVYEAKGYGNNGKMFDGHSDKTGQKQLPGTYFYSLEYTVKGVTKHKTGFIILKY